MRLRIARRPVGKENQREFFVAGVAGVNRHRVRRCDAARNEEHRLVAPPALALERHGARRAGAVEQTRTMHDERPVSRLADIINAAP